jgi:hypothetical protein
MLGVQRRGLAGREHYATCLAAMFSEHLCF